MTSIQYRRLIIVLILLGVAVVGAVMRRYADMGSTARDVGTLLMVLWVPVVGNIVGWLFRKLKRKAPAPARNFEPRAAFVQHARVEVTMRPAAVPAEDGLIPEGEHRCAFVVDNQAFSARWFVRPGEQMRRGIAHALDVEFLAPSAALPLFPKGAAFKMLIGPAFVADGHVTGVTGNA